MGNAAIIGKKICVNESVLAGSGNGFSALVDRNGIHSAGMRLQYLEETVVGIKKHHRA